MTMRPILSAASLCLVAAPAPGQTGEMIRAVSERFFDGCTAAMEDPAGYYRDLLARGQDSPIAVSVDEEGALFHIIDMTQPGEFYVHVGEIDGRIRVYCHVALFNDPAVMDSAATNAAFVDLMAEDGLTRAGGAIDLRGLLAGDHGETGEQVEPVAQVYEHLVTGWGGDGQIASAVVQVGMFEMTSQTIFPGSLQVQD